ncbi:unnamed protein product [Miscanthus lutarioriparius]|uniref:DUF659 domain-containing protein n=1 Tax=Miscanthus lutarioriparius TaxID=422564 RepID=A0A811P5V9_9POAL|nr:unnamed protein product [Miscanthus lutarioriparius]
MALTIRLFGKILMDRIPTLLWSLCALHCCLDLMLEEIGNLKAFKKPIARAKRVTNFIYRHGRLLSAMRAQTVGSLYKNKDALKSLFVSEAWIGNNLCTTTKQLRGCFIEVLGRMIPDVETQMKINRRAIEYEEQRGEAFSNKMAKESYDKMNPHENKVSLRCEKAGKKYDPLVIEEFDWDNEWADSLHVPVPGARGVVTFLGELLLCSRYRRPKNVPAAASSLKMAKRKTVEDPHDDVEFASRGMDATWEKSFWKGKKGTWAPELGTNQLTAPYNVCMASSAINA